LIVDNRKLYILIVDNESCTNVTNYYPN